MMRAAAILLVTVGCLVSGCRDTTSSTLAGTGAKGRYAGIAVFDAGRLWGQMASAQPTSEAAGAKIADDEHVIVVVDTNTG
jgi:hypothetical protein